jgi:hypothetical protein
LTNIYPLNDGCGLLEESEYTSHSISLISMDFSRNSLQYLYTVKYDSDFIEIFVNKADTSTFILQNEESTRICKIVDKTIVIKNAIEIDFIPEYFYNKCVYGLNWSYDKEKDSMKVNFLFTFLVYTFNFLDT